MNAAEYNASIARSYERMAEAQEKQGKDYARIAVAEERKAAAQERIAADVRALREKIGPMFDQIEAMIKDDLEGRQMERP